MRGGIMRAAAPRPAGEILCTGATFLAGVARAWGAIVPHVVFDEKRTFHPGCRLSIRDAKAKTNRWYHIHFGSKRNYEKTADPCTSQLAGVLPALARRADRQRAPCVRARDMVLTELRTSRPNWLDGLKAFNNRDTGMEPRDEHAIG